MSNTVFKLFLIAIVLFLLNMGLLAWHCFGYTKIYGGEDNGQLTYGVISGVQFVNGIEFEGEWETWLETDRNSFRGWQIKEVAYTLTFTLDNVSIVHECQHYLYTSVNDWDSQNYFNVRLDLPDNTDRRK